jgi:Outer membrane protein beta-barrel domain
MYSTHLRSLFNLYWKKIERSVQFLMFDRGRPCGSMFGVQCSMSDRGRPCGSMFDVRYSIPHISYPTSHISHLTSHISYLVSRISYLTSHTPHLASHISHLTSHIPLKSLIFVLLLHSSFIATYAQRTVYERIYQEHYEDKPIHYGFFFALPMSRYNISHNDNFNLASDSVVSIKSPMTSNFRAGFVLNAYLNDRWDIRSTPCFSLYNRTVEYSMRSGRQRQETRESAWIEVPVLFKYKSERRGNSRMYMFAGATFALETNVRKKVQRGVDKLAAKTTDFTIDYGVGFEQFLQYTKFSPELRFSHGLVNAYVTPQSPATLGIRGMVSHTITLYLMFE